MFLRLLVLFLLVPLVELALLIEVGRRIGTGPTIAIIAATAVLGAWLAKRQGLAVVREIQRQLREGEIPAAGLVDGLLILIAGAVLLTPGFITDAAGFFLLLPAGRAAVKRWLRRRFEEWVAAGVIIRRP